MRSDFPKLLCERHRIGHRNRNVELRLDRRKFRQVGLENEFDDLDDDLDPVSYSGRRAKTRPKEGRRELNENLSPLRRFLEKCVGRRWDDVYSELKGANPKGPVGSHVFEHLFQYVAVDVVDGLVCTPYQGELSLAKSQFSFYVDRGILRKNLKPSKRDYLRHLVKHDDELIGIKNDMYHWFYRAKNRWWHIKTYTPFLSDLTSDERRKWTSKLCLEAWPNAVSTLHSSAMAHPVGVKQIKAINRLLGR